MEQYLPVNRSSGKFVLWGILGGILGHQNNARQINTPRFRQYLREHAYSLSQEKKGQKKKATYENRKWP